jgi:hypothetical protein
LFKIKQRLRKLQQFTLCDFNRQIADLRTKNQIRLILLKGQLGKLRSEDVIEGWRRETERKQGIEYRSFYAREIRQ